MIETGNQSPTSFHLAGIVPVAGQSLDYSFPWHDCMQPISKNYLAVERAVLECAYAGCETIWVVCHGDMQPLIRYRLGDWVHDPINAFNVFAKHPSDEQKPIRIYYVPIHPKDRDKRDCLSWSVLYGALTSYNLSLTISKWLIPDKYYVAFPYGIYPPDIVKAQRKNISSKNPFFITSPEGLTVKDGEYLGFTFDAEDFKHCRRELRAKSTGEKESWTDTERMPLEKRWSARYFSVKDVFMYVNEDNSNKLEVSWYYDISSWDKLRSYLGSEHEVFRPNKTIFSYHESDHIGVDNG